MSAALFSLTSAETRITMERQDRASVKAAGLPPPPLPTGAVRPSWIALITTAHPTQKEGQKRTRMRCA